MACKIEVRKTIDASIADKTNNDYWGFTKQQAATIKVFLNSLWGPIANVEQTTGNGSYRIATSNLDEATDREYNSQLEAENSFQRDLDFFNDDAALFNQEQQELNNNNFEEPFAKNNVTTKYKSDINEDDKTKETPQQEELAYIEEENADNEDITSQNDVPLDSTQELEEEKMLNEMINNGEIQTYCN